MVMAYIRGVVTLLIDHVALVCLTLVICSNVGTYAERYANFVKLENSDTMIAESLLTINQQPMTITACLSECQPIKECVFVSFHDDQQLCHFHELNKTAVTSPGWNIYFKRLDEIGETEMNLKEGATASQSSTLNMHSAGRALDGNTNNYLSAHSCAHTGNVNPYWIMQFGMSGVVARVEMYMRADHGINYGDWSRNTNRVAMVAQTYDDAVDNVGIECGRYVGDPIDSPPYTLTIQCGGPIFGKFLRISHLTKPLVICELFVYTS